ncbi:MAG: hypothetical protein QW543_00920 [Sulfolobales archaeon]
MGKLEIVLENSTPLLVGWYRPELADPRGLRPTEVKGLWRWWARAFLGGVLYDKGILKGRVGSHVLLRPTPNEVKLISKLVGEMLGLGMAIGGESCASKFTLYIEPLGAVSPKHMGEHSRDWQRVRLLTLGRKEEKSDSEASATSSDKVLKGKKGEKKIVEGLDPGVRFKLHVEWDNERAPKYLETALSILLVALQFTGVGKGSRRGLGSLDIISIYTKSWETPELWNLKDLRELFYKIYEDCKKILDDSRLVEEYSLKEKAVPDEGIQLPPFPVVSKRLVQETPVTKVGVMRYVVPTKFVEIHNFFLRSERCSKLYKTKSCHDDLRRGLAAWFLGLPRAQRGTGYQDKVSRRASPVFLTFHTNKNQFGGGVFMSVFLSGDWPRNINWCQHEGYCPKSVQVNDKTIARAYSIFYEEFLAYLSKIGVGKEMEDVWP